jgi:hypothetical protein
MWVVPLVAAVVAFAFSGSLGLQYADRRRPYQLAWALALGMFGLASLAVAGGVANGWSPLEFKVYWALGAVLNVAFLAGGEAMLLFRRPWVTWVTALVLVFASAYTLAVLRAATIHDAFLSDRLPLGRDVFGDGTSAYRAAQVIAYPAYVLLLLGTLWSAWRMRGRPELRDRFTGTLAIAVGATIVAGGAAFAATGLLVGFIATLVAGIVVMFWGFRRASRPAVPAAV